MSSSDNKELNIIPPKSKPPKSRREAHKGVVESILSSPENTDSAKRKALVKEIKRKQKALEEEKKKRDDPVQRHMRNAPRTTLNVGGLVGNPSRMRNR